MERVKLQASATSTCALDKGVEEQIENVWHVKNSCQPNFVEMAWLALIDEVVITTDVMIDVCLKCNYSGIIVANETFPKRKQGTKTILQNLSITFSSPPLHNLPEWA